jgi:trehalose 6-phosphate phosphatase
VVEYRTPQAPPLRGCAVFLDIDGTLLNLAATPAAVMVPPQLHALLHQLAGKVKGALALISGRSLADIDRLFGPGLSVAAEHGAVLRDASGAIIESLTENNALLPLLAPLRAAVAAHPGALLEQKHFGLVLHWRAAPALAVPLTALATALAAPHAELLLQPAHEALEIRLRGPGKAAALDRFMRSPRFAGRRPVFIGDDLTDEPAIALAAARGGCGLHVGRDFGGSPAAVLGWLSAWLEAAGGGDG